MTFQAIHPAGWAKASGYTNGLLVPPGSALLFVAGQIAWDADQNIVGADDFGAQFRQALANVLAVVSTAGGGPEHVVRMTVFVADKDAYCACLSELGGAWRQLMGRNYPTMSLVEVAALLEPGALVEIEATAALPA